MNDATDRIRDAVANAILSTQTTLAIIRHARQRTEANAEQELCAFQLVDAEDNAEHLLEALQRIAAGLPAESQTPQIWMEPEDFFRES